MVSQGIQAFAGKRVLLLQGPVGPFFRNLAQALRQVGATVHKINFNAGDWLFYPRGAVNYRGRMEGWPAWFRARVREWRIDTVFLFGDCRPIHQKAHAVATELGLEIGVFEEGYVRPNYVTLERHGVNGHSQLARDPAGFIRADEEMPQEIEVGRTYWPMVWHGVRYFVAGALGRPIFPFYRHHRPLTLLEALPWVRSAYRKLWYRLAERHQQADLTGPQAGRYFLAPLQVFNDAQITVHADLDDVAHFIEDSIESFARFAPVDTLLVFKHHPMDRGYTDYARLIKTLSRRHGIGQRVRYIHDQHLPTLMQHARGVVVVNSTVGISALWQGVPTKACGNAIYDVPGLTFQGSLDEFWKAAAQARPDPLLYQRFHRHVVNSTQLNGSFYKPMRVPGAMAGLLWRATVGPAAVSSSPATGEGKLTTDRAN